MQRTIKDFDDSVHIDALTGDTIATPELVDSYIEKLLQRERLRLSKEFGLNDSPIEHASRAVEHPFTAEQRSTTTVLFGGLTWKHERLIQAHLRSLGYRCEYLPTPNVKAFQTGKEYGNNGQCNPTYFTVGNLVNYLQHLEEQGIGRKDIIENYVFFTAGACGPCRFGMYESEYRLALRNSGFDGFRVLLFQQTGGLNQIDASAGLEMNLDFFLGILNALNIGDLLNDIAYQIRPFETIPGATDKALAESIEHIAGILEKKQPYTLGETGVASALSSGLKGQVEVLMKYFEQLFGSDLIAGMEHCRQIFSAVEVDRTRIRPIVKVTGEFWAQTTEGDGNFNMFPFLEREGAQVLVEPIATWLLYMLHQVKQEIDDRKYIDISANAGVFEQFLPKLKSWKNHKQSKFLLTLGESLFIREYNKLRNALGSVPHPLSDQYEMQRIAHPYYNTRVEGGEGHLEVAKNIYYSSKNLCHMVLSLKPFGCMPSTQSDGVQSAVTSHFRDIIYLPIETSGEGEINAHSRVQMALGDARAKAKTEFANAMETRSLTIDELKQHIEAHPELKDPFHRIPKQSHLAGTAANFAWYVADRMNKPGKAVAA